MSENTLQTATPSSADDTGNGTQDADQRPEGQYVLRLYVTGMTLRSVQAIENITRLCEKHLQGRYELEIIDLYQHPEAAKEAQVFAAPTMIKLSPPPEWHFVGDMSDEEQILVGLSLRQRSQAVENLLERPPDGGVDAVVRDEGQGKRLYTLESADYPYRVLLNTMHEGAVTLTPEQTIVYCNQRFSDLTGIPCENILGQRLGKFVVGEPSELISELLTAAQHEPQVVELELLSAGGTPIPARFSVTAFNADATSMFSVLITDLTEQKRAERRLLEHRKRLRAASAELSIAEQRERQRLASALHDEVAQTLGAIKLHLSVLGSTISDPSAAEAMASIVTMVDDVIRQSRTIMTELSPPVLKQQGLIEALRWWGEQVKEKHGLEVAVDVEGPMGRLAPDVEATLFQTVKELLQNAIKYAQVERAAIHVKCSETHVDIEVADSGVGFDPATIEVTKQGGFGLFSARERIAYLGGDFQIDSAPGKGTRASISLPLPCLGSAG